MKAIRFIGKTLLWILYLMITGKKRQMYQHAKFAGREVLGVDNDAFGSTYTMGRMLNGEEPERDYMNWKEFREEHSF